MVEIVPFQRQHLRAIHVQGAQEIDMAPLISDPSYAEALEGLEHSWAAIDGDRVLACGGIVEEWHGVARAWMIIGKDIGSRFIHIHRAVLGFVKNCGYHRIEMSVAKGFDEGCRWAKMLGFEYEGTARAYTPDGHDCLKFARVNL